MAASEAPSLAPANGHGAAADLEAVWQDRLSGRSPDEVMARLPEAATDPFSGLEARLKATLGLYRFTDQGGSLLDWAAAQSGLKDPLSEFSRHDLERHFFQVRCELLRQFRQRPLDQFFELHSAHVIRHRSA